MVITPTAPAGYTTYNEENQSFTSKVYAIGVCVLMAVVCWVSWKYDLKPALYVGGTVLTCALMALNRSKRPDQPAIDPRHPDYSPEKGRLVGSTRLYIDQLMLLQQATKDLQPQKTQVFRREALFLPRTLAAVCREGKPPDFYALLKRKNGEKIIGRGSFKTGTYALNLETLELKGWFSERREKWHRSARPISRNEIVAHESLRGLKGLSTGEVIEYTFKPRPNDRVSGCSKRAILVDLVDGDDLGKRLSFGIIRPQKELIPNNLHKIVLYRIACAVNEMHLKGYMHLDLQPGNVLIGRYFSVVVIDFSFSRPVKTLTKTSGNKCYAAPEIYSHDLSQVTSKADVWSFGMMIYDLSKGKLGKAAQEMEYKSHQCNPPGGEETLNAWKKERLGKRIYPGTLQNWVDRCLQFDPDRRPTMQELVDNLKPS